MPGCLLWSFDITVRPPAWRQAVYRAPTWSWASLDFDFGVSLNTLEALDQTPLVTVATIDIQSPFGNIYTDVTSAKLVLSGRTGPADVSLIQFLPESEFSVDLGSRSLKA